MKASNGSIAHIIVYTKHKAYNLNDEDDGEIKKREGDWLRMWERIKNSIMARCECAQISLNEGKSCTMYI